MPKVFYKPPFSEAPVTIYHVGLCSISIYGKTDKKDLVCQQTFEDYELKDGWVEIKWADGTHVGQENGKFIIE